MRNSAADTEELCKAAALGKLDQAISLAKKLSSVNGMDQGRTALHWAAQEGHSAITKLLIKRGAKVNQVDRHGFSPLMLATGAGHAKVARILIAAGARVNERSEAQGGGTPLSLAAAWNRVAVARLLIKWGARINARDNEKRTPIFFAIICGHPEMVRLLLDKGAKFDPRFRDPETGKTVVQLSRKPRNHALKRLLSQFFPGHSAGIQPQRHRK